ncbi:serine/threonine-protein kinase [Prosthecomicrobium sp. N25]|uniref:serine/threonine-protein kinase n=1 Tax=Prosthecomicrobium sp. N25 TaxID=3129254 RepID=UPI003076BC4B
MRASERSRDWLPAGTRLNDIYEIDEPIAAGGMGEVYRGHSILTGDSIAIKMIKAELADTESAMALFRKEASALHNLHHEAIIRYYLFTVEPKLGRPYLAMEFVSGRPLSDLLKNGPLTFDEVRSLGVRVATGLQAAHERGIIHRDMSPDNIIVPGRDFSQSKIIDFGIARQTQSHESTVIGSGFAGKYNYVSPEQMGLAGGIVGPAADIYSLGLVLAEASAGWAINMRGTPVEEVEKRRVVPNLSHIDTRLRPLLEWMLQPYPEDRPPTMNDVAHWLRQFGTVSPARPATHPPADTGDATVAVAPGRRRTTTGTGTGTGAERQQSRGPQDPYADDPYGPDGPTRIANRPDRNPQSRAPSGSWPDPAQGYRQPSGYSEPPAWSQPPQRGSYPPSSQPPQPRSPYADPGRYSQPPQSRGTSRPPTSEPPRSRPPGSQPPPNPYGQSAYPEARPYSEPPRPGQGSQAPGAYRSAYPEAPPAAPAPPASKPAGSRLGIGLAVAALLLVAGVGAIAWYVLVRPGGSEIAATTPQPPAPVPGVPGAGAAPPPTPTGPAVPAAAPGTTVAVGPPVVAADVARFIEDYAPAGEACFYLAPVVVADNQAVTEGYGRSIVPFEGFDSAFFSRHGFEAEVLMRQVTEAQCPVVRLLQQTRFRGGPGPRIELATNRLRPGETVGGEAAWSGGYTLTVLHVTDDGLVQVVARPAKTGNARFQITAPRAPEAAGRPNLAVVVVTGSAFPTLLSDERVPAAVFVDRLRAEAKNDRIITAAQYLVIEK